MSSSNGHTAWPLPELHRLPTAAELSVVEREDEAVEREAAAYARGLHEGQRAAAEQMARRLDHPVQALSGVFDELQAHRDDILASMEENVYAIAIAVAQRVIEREVAIDPAIVRDLVRRALDVLPTDGTLTVRLNPEDLAALDGQLDMVLAGGRRLDAQWVADAAVGRGGYLVESPHRIVDGRVDEALQAIFDRLRHA